MRVSFALAGLGVILLLACGAAPSAAPTRATPEPGEPNASPPLAERSAPSARTEVDVEVVGDGRALGPLATFADLIAAARRADDRGASASEAGCLLRGDGSTGASWRLEADLAIAVRPLPPPPPDLLVRVRGEGTVRVLSRWGQRGTGRLTLAALTATSPPAQEDALVLLLTREGVLVRRTGGSTPAHHAGPFPMARVAEHVGFVEDARLFVTAEAERPLTALRRLFEALPAEARDRVALAIVLDEDTSLPSPPRPGRSEIGLCPEGLPQPEPGAREGALETAALIAALEPLRERAASCLAAASAESARGGRFVLALRVDEGRVIGACASEDELQDSGLRSCVLDAVRALAMPASGGFVDVSLPLALRPDASLAQRALCDHP